MKPFGMLVRRVLIFWGVLAVFTVGARYLFSEAETKPKAKKTEVTSEPVKREDAKKTETKKEAVKPERESIPVTAPLKKDNKDVEKVIQTLNDTLDENRKLRSEMTRMEDELEKEHSQSSVLGAQIKELQGDIQDAKNSVKAKDAALEKERESVKKDKAGLAEAEEKFEQTKAEVKKGSEAVEGENEKLRGILNHSILDSERDKFVMLLKKAEGDSSRAAGELARTKTQTEKIRGELAEQYYDLGNLLVEKEDYKNALIKYKKALKLNPNDAWAHHNLGVLYDFYFNDRKKAIYHYKKYLNLKPVKEEAGKIRERVLEMELGKMITPGLPIKLDFDKYQKDLKEVK